MGAASAEQDQNTQPGGRKCRRGYIIFKTRRYDSENGKKLLCHTLDRTRRKSAKICLGLKNMHDEEFITQRNKMYSKH